MTNGKDSAFISGVMGRTDAPPPDNARMLSASSAFSRPDLADAQPSTVSHGLPAIPDHVLHRTVPFAKLPGSLQSAFN
jgi:hypothetical protein